MNRAPHPVAAVPPITPDRLPDGPPAARAAFGVGAALLAIYALLIAFDTLPAAGNTYAPPPLGTGRVAPHWWDKIQSLRGWSVFPEGWSWALIPPAPATHWALMLGLGLLAGAGLWAWQRRDIAGRRHPIAALGALVILGYALQLGALWLKAPNANQLLFDRITNASFTGFFTSATQIQDPALFFAGYADAISISGPGRLCGHCRTHPPGPILFYWLPLRALEALPRDAQAGLAGALTGATGITPGPLPPAQTALALLGAQAILLGAALIVVPLYGLARRLAGPGPALPLAALGLTLPGVLLMSPELDQLFGTLAATLFYLAVRGLSTPRRAGWWGLGTGLVFACCLYGSFGLWVLGGLLLVLAGAAAAGVLGTRGPAGGDSERPLPAPALAAWLGGLAVGTAVPWALLWGIGQFDLPRVLVITSGVHLGGITTRRPYGIWLLFDLVDFLQFVGLPLVAATLLTLRWPRRAPGMVRNPARPAVPRLWQPVAWVATRVNLYGLLFWGSLLALDGAGVARAEVGRLWIFLMPLALLAVYQAAGRGRLAGRSLAALLAAQFLVCLLIGGRWLTP